MRISAVRKAETRARLLGSAKRLFAERGYDRTTTRDIAQASGAATGTLFNYFESKEALGVVLLEEATEKALGEYRAMSHAGSLEDALFAQAKTTLSHLADFRSWAAQVLRSPLRCGSLRARMLADTSELVARYGRGAPSSVMLHLYWTLYSGVVAFWSHDSDDFRDTHVLLARSLRLFVRGLDDSLAD